MKVIFHRFSIFFLMPLAFAAALANGQDFLDLDEPSWVYRTRGDRFYRQGAHGEAVAQYKKALIKRRHEVSYPDLRGLEIEHGLENIGGDLELYAKLLFHFRVDHEETVKLIRDELADGRNAEVRERSLILSREADTIGARRVSEDAGALAQSVLTKNRETWHFLVENLEASLTEVLESLNTLEVDLGEDNGRGRGEKLVLDIETGADYPEVHLILAKIYIEEGLYGLALKQLELVEKSSESLQIEDVLFEVWYTRAAAYSGMRDTGKYFEQLERIIREDTSWKVEGNLPLSRVSDSVVAGMRNDREKRKKFGEAYFRIGSFRYSSGRDASAEPYLKMAFLYDYEPDNAELDEARPVREYLEEYYGKIGDVQSLQKLEDISKQSR
jgi:tetratricopeptide (TPR) repeat protein